MNSKIDPRSAAQDFLFEIGTEELPAAAARAAASQAGTLAMSALSSRSIPCSLDAVSVWVTPRRIAVYVESLAPMQQSQEIAERGPVESKAYDEHGMPTKAAEGFARAKNVDVGELEVREHDGQRFVYAVRRREGQPTFDLLPDVCRDILNGISFNKTMRWGAGDFRFSRPVRWLVAKYGPWTVELEAAGVTGGEASRGHRFLGEPVVTIESAAEYRQKMQQALVMVDQEDRRRVILEGLAIEAGKKGASFIDPAGELEEVIYLVENPSVHAGAFGEEHLRLPDRVLTTCMQSHQRYFPLTEEGGALMSGFLYVMNGDPAAAEGVTEGNERVLEGRIEDAEFSFDQDIKVGIDAMAARLGTVVFHGKLGSLADKTVRLAALVEAVAELLALCGPDLETATTAARLAKADQVSIMVQEFPDLEGHIGGVYAGMEGYSSDICAAIEEHYLPVAAEGALPKTVPGSVLAIADKVDNLVGAFAVNELPTGSRDPYGLRRAALGLAQICSRFGFDFDLTSLLGSAHRLFLEQKAQVSHDAGVTAAAFEFVLDRIQNRMVEEGMPVEIIEAARAAGLTGTLRVTALAEALDSFRKMPEFEDFHTAFFRSSKIAAKAGEDVGTDVDTGLFEAETERELFEAVERLAPEIEGLTGSRSYGEALEKAAGIRPLVDRFFDDVLVMAEDEKVRRNRLALVSRTAQMLRRLGDPMRVAAAPS